MPKGQQSHAKPTHGWVATVMCIYMQRCFSHETHADISKAAGLLIDWMGTSFKQGDVGSLSGWPVQSSLASMILKHTRQNTSKCAKANQAPQTQIVFG